MVFLLRIWGSSDSHNRPGHVGPTRVSRLTVSSLSAERELLICGSSLQLPLARLFLLPHTLCMRHGPRSIARYLSSRRPRSGTYCTRRCTVSGLSRCNKCWLNHRWDILIVSYFLPPHQFIRAGLEDLFLPIFTRLSFLTGISQLTCFVKKGRSRSSLPTRQRSL